MKTLAELQTELETLQAELSEAQDKLKDIQNNPQEYTDLESMYDDYLDEIYSEQCEALPVVISGSKLISEFDPTMYRCGFNDYCNDYDYSSLDVYQETEDLISDLEDQIYDIEDQIDDLDEASDNE